MSVSSIINRVAYTGDASTVAFAFAYKFIATTDLVVMVDGVVKALTTDYTVSGTVTNGAYQSGGTVTFLSAPATATNVTIYRAPAKTQATTWTDNDPDPAAVKENAFDKLTLLVQRLFELASRGVGLKDTFYATFDPSLPATLSPGSTIVVNSGATGWDMGAGIASSGTEASPTSIVAGTGVVPTAGALTQTWFIKGSGGAVVVSANPQIAAGTIVGQRLVLCCVDSTNTVTFANGNGIVRNGSYTMLDGSVSEYVWGGTAWRQISDNDIG